MATSRPRRMARVYSGACLPSMVSDIQYLSLSLSLPSELRIADRGARLVRCESGVI